MNKNTQPLMTASASGGVVGAIVVVISYFLTFWGIAIPAEIATALMVLLTPVLHMAAVKWGLEDMDPAPTSQAAPAASWAPPPAPPQQ